MVVHLLGTFAYSARISGVLSGKLSLSISTFNLLSMASRLANVLIIPLISKKIESELAEGKHYNSIPSTYLLLLILAIVGTILGMIFFSRCVSLLLKSVNGYQPGKSILWVIIKNLPSVFTSAPVQIPIEKTIVDKTVFRYLFLNGAITCVFTSATLAAIYSSYIAPQYRVTALGLAFLLNGIASFFYTVVIDPYLSLLTDTAYNGKLATANYFYYIIMFIRSRFAGVLFALFTFRFFTWLIVKSIALY